MPNAGHAEDMCYIFKYVFSSAAIHICKYFTQCNNINYKYSSIFKISFLRCGLLDGDELYKDIDLTAAGTVRQDLLHFILSFAING